MGLKNVVIEDIAEIEDLIISKIQELVDEGFILKFVKASMNTMECSLRENNIAPLLVNCLCRCGCMG